MVYEATREEIEGIKKAFVKGVRVRLLVMDDVTAPPIGTEGTVAFVDDTGTIHVNWDNGSVLGVVFGYDKVEII